jgi:glucose-1-phosphate cytidylyltransferase
MKVVILAGGLGTRLREETEYRPKTMAAIGGRPMIWHIMKIFAAYGHTDFIICLGYKGDVNRDFTVTLGQRRLEILNDHGECGWRVTLAETGELTNTGGRIKRIAKYLENQTFMATYGDGVADINLDHLLHFHRQHRRLATVTGVHPSSRFGELSIENGLVRMFREKPQVDEGWINGGFFIFEPAALELVDGDEDSLEANLLMRLTERNELAVYQHQGFWQCMDTYREMKLLNELWASGQPPWACNRQA